ncbi:MAG TPA: hypothetical protein VGI14_18190 [Casimicrobiaceae bacterium]
MKCASIAFVATACGLLALPAGASYHTFAIEQVYSNADGTVQYVMLHETMGYDGEQYLTGHTFTSTHAGVTKTLTFDKDLPASATSGRRFLIATQGFANLATKVTMPGMPMPMPSYAYPPYPPPPPPNPTPPVMANGQPDYIMPDAFLPTDGGTLNYAGVNQMTFASLPTDGMTALNSSGTTSANTPVNFAGVGTSLAPAAVTLVEFYDAALDHYFVSALEPDIDALDSGRIAGWARTGLSFKVFPSAVAGGAGVNAVCRFLIPPEHGDSHFFSASIDECNAVLAKIGVDPNYSGYVEETPDAFFVALPDTASGACPAGTIPVYRLFNNRADANHRYTTDPTVKAAMIARGYVAEGYGPDATIMCAPA